MNTFVEPKTELSSNARRYAVAVGSYVLTVSISIAAAATLVSELAVFIAPGL